MSIGLDKNQITDLLVFASTLTDGESSRDYLCPVCMGGVTKEKSFSVTNTNSLILFNCFRVGCSLRGAVNSNYTTISTTNNKKQPNINTFDYDTSSLRQEDLDYFLYKYDIPEQLLIDNNVKISLARNSYLFPIYNMMGYEIGLIEKFIDRSNGPKVLYYKFVDCPKMYFPLSCTLTDTVVIVEDVISAIKVSELMPCVALLGTHITNEVLYELKKFKIENIILALDPDAKNKAINIKQNSELFFNNIDLIFLDKDPKDTSYNELRYKLCL